MAERLTWNQQPDGTWAAVWRDTVGPCVVVATASGARGAPPSPRRWSALGVRGIAPSLPAAIEAASDTWRRLTRREAA